MTSRAPEKESVSELTTGRLSVYLRCLTILEDGGEKTVSSQALADRFHLNSAQIRKDLACFGEFGTRGVGYDVSKLKSEIIRQLGIDQTRNVVIVGAGHLGMALADYRGFNGNGFRIVALIDIDPEKFGWRTRSGASVVPDTELQKIVREEHVEIGILAVPTPAAQQAYDLLVAAGVTAILNFAPIPLRLRDGVKVKSVDLRINLEALSFYLKNSEDGLFETL